MKNFKFRALLMGLFFPYTQSMMKTHINKVGIIDSITMANVLIFIGNDHRFESFQEFENNNKEAFKHNEKDLVIVINEKIKNLELLSNNIGTYFNNFKKHHFDEKKKIEIINILENNEYQIISINHKKDLINGKFKQNELIKIDENIFKEHIEANFKTIFEDNVGVNKHIAESISRVLMDCVPRYTNSNLHVNYIYKITIYNDQIEKEQKDFVEIFNSSKPYYFLKENKNHNSQLVTEKPTSGEYSEFKHNLSLEITYKRNK